MTSVANGQGVVGAVPRAGAGRDRALALVVAAGLACAALLSHRLETRRPAEDPFTSYEELYLSPETARRASLGLNGLAADWYWLRALQYVGRKSAAHRGDVNVDDLTPLGLRNLGPLLEQAAALDPRFMAVYDFGAVVLPAVDGAAAVRLVEAGIRENPGAWRLYHHLGYIHWQAKRYAEAGAAYRAGAQVRGAPAWMTTMSAQMDVAGGSRATAREIYRRMYAEADDEQVRTMALKRLLQLDSLDERERIRAALDEFGSRASRCPGSWGELAPSLRGAGLRVEASGAPLDPTGVPYALDRDACEARLGERSEIPRR